MTSRTQPKPLIIDHFGRVVSSVKGKAPINQPQRMVNFLAASSKLEFRYGYTPIQRSPVSAGQPFDAFGFNFVQNKSGVAEFLGVENHNSTIHAYSYSKDTLTQAAIGDAVASGDWVVASYADNAYFINPGGTPSVYRHVIGDPDSLVPVEDSGFTDQTNPALSIFPRPLDSRGWDALDVWVVSSTNGITGGSVSVASGVATVNGTDDDNGVQHRTQIQTTLVSSVDLTGKYIAATFVAGAIFTAFERTNVQPEFKIAGSWVKVAETDFIEFVQSDGAQVTIEIHAKGISGISAVQGIRLTIGGFVARAGTGIACTINPILLGGTYLPASTTAKRLWDGTLDGTTIMYGVRYKKAGPLYSDLVQGTIDAFEARGFFAATYASPLGAIIALTTPVDAAGGYTDVEFVRYYATDKTWRILGTVANSGVPQVIDTFEESELAGLVEATDIGVTVDPTPVFRTAGIVGAFPFKQFMVWLISGGESNIQMSRVGNAEELFTDQITYDSNDLTQPGQRTLADNADDEPVWGTQAGDTTIIVGKKSAYSMSGDFPVRMTPTRQIAGSRGIIGRFAGVRYRILGGQYAAAYCDPDFLIWLVEAVPQFQGDGRGQPIELSLPVRGLMKTFLYDEQKIENPALDGAQTQLEFDEESSTLWVILGNRAAAFRQDMNEQGWEFYDYSLRTEQGATTVTTVTDFTGNGGAATSTATGDVAWSSFSSAFISDDAYSTAGTIPLGVGKKTENLHVTGFTPVSLIPANATIDKVRWEVERSKLGDLTLTETKVQPTKSGSALGSNLTTSYVVTDSDAPQIFEITSGLPTVAEINAGLLGVDLQYTQEDSHVDWNNPAKWNIVVTGDTIADMLVTATYTGAGTVPGFVWVNITSRVVLGFIVPGPGPGSFAPYSGMGSANDGLGESVTGGAMAQHGSSPDPINDSIVDVSGTHRIKISLSGGTGNTTVHRSGSGTTMNPGMAVSPTYTGSAAFSAFVLDTARVDDVKFSVTYTVDSTDLPSWVGWSQACFTHDGRRIAIRSTGEIDIIEKDFRNKSFIVGTNRDGGYTPPDAEWLSQSIDYAGLTAQCFACQVNTTLSTDIPSVFSKVYDKGWVGSFLSGYASSRWFRFPLGQTAIHHQFKFTLPETSGGVETIAFDFRPTSKSKTR